MQSLITVLPIAVASGYVHARNKGAARFAFLLMTRDGEASRLILSAHRMGFWPWTRIDFVGGECA